MSKNPLDTVKYIIYKCSLYGDLITNLKMQKLLYYVYAWYLVKYDKPCFDEKFQAWPIGPVLPSVYKVLKDYGYSPIDPDFALQGKTDIAEIKNDLGEELKNLVDNIYKQYGILSAFELVNLTHSEKPWKNARRGLSVNEPSENQISDDDIKAQYG